VDPEIEIDLEWSDNDEVDVFMEDSAGLFGEQQRFANLLLDSFIEKANNSTATNELAPKHNYVAKDNVLSLTVALLNTTISQPLSLNMTEWLLNSGASNHFTFDINDFVEYKTIPTMTATTAVVSTKIIGRGTVILQMETKTIRVFPVLHAPEINSRLFSLGQFHQSGLISVGGACGVSLYKQNKLFFTATPKRNTSTTYYLQGLVGQKDQNLIYKVDFEIMHSVIAHDNHDHFTLFFSFFFYSFSLLTRLLTHTFIYFFLSSSSSPTHKRMLNTIGFYSTIYDTRHLLV